ncbi:MAG: regulatory protein RecX [Dehalococcoidales bacterium]|nr:regulatory protein RecX [Dehalococcoidales bacterium]
MAKITAIKKTKGRQQQVKVYLDGKPALALLAETALNEKLKVGVEVAEDRRETLAETDRRQRCYNSALQFLSYRQRSEAEIRQRLQRHGYIEAHIDKAIVRLKELGLVDDAAFARFWQENRDAFSPRSRRMTKLELKRKGLSNDVIEQVVSEIDEKDSAYRAALSRARRLPKDDYQTFRQRLTGYLGRRGFNYGIIKETTQRVWHEVATPEVSRK